MASDTHCVDSQSMGSIFAPVERGWDQLRDSLHVYALPRLDPVLIAAYHAAIERSQVCAIQPAQFLHATITGLPAHRNTMTADRLTSISAALDRTALETRPFTITLERPEIWTTAVGCSGEETPEWKILLDGVRQAARSCFNGLSLPPAPSAPHVSLGYGTHPTEDAPLVHELAKLAAGTAWRAELVVDTIHLLSVHANPFQGTFTWDVVSVHPFGG